MKKKNPIFSESFNPGRLLFEWTAFNYHPHDRGIIWYFLFCFVIIGTSIYSWYADATWGLLTTLSILFCAVFYLIVHKDHHTHVIRLFERGLIIDEATFISWKRITGYWVLYDEYISVIKFVERKKGHETTYTLQLGKVSLEELTSVMKYLDISYLDEYEESTVDLWLRVLKL